MIDQPFTPGAWVTLRYSGGTCPALVQKAEERRVLVVALAPWGLWRGWVAIRLVAAAAGAGRAGVA